MDVLFLRISSKVTGEHAFETVWSGYQDELVGRNFLFGSIFWMYNQNDVWQEFIEQ